MLIIVIIAKLTMITICYTSTKQYNRKEEQYTNQAINSH